MDEVQSIPEGSRNARANSLVVWPPSHRPSVTAYWSTDVLGNSVSTI